MTHGRAWIWSAALGFHLFLITAASLQDFSASLVAGGGSLPAWSHAGLSRLQAIAASSLGKGLAESNPVRQTLAAYADCTGIEAGYSYFAPSVAASSKLEFELHFPDGRVAYDVPPVGGAAAGYRISTLLDHLQNIRYADLRKAILKTLVENLHREYPGSDRIRATLQTAELPGPAEYRKGTRISYRPLFAYEFVFHPRPPSSAAK